MSDRYETISEAHGEGGFGRISKFRDRILERLVAVKQLRMLNDEAAKERFRREAKTLAKMSHPNVPAIYDVEFGDDQMLIYFAFVEGRPLRELIIASAIPSMDKARRWFTQVVAALEHAHSLDIIHRDVKPDNIIISPNDENATLVDFGIAMTADDVKKLTKSGYAIGTPQYMSPEQANGDALDGRSDLYSVGITLYEALSGHLPHAGNYQALSDANEAIPPAIDGLIKDCLAQDRNQRIQSAAEFIKRLRSAFRADVPLSTLLTDARLHELIAALKQISAENFAARPRGQKLLLINRLKDLLRIDKPALRAATAQVISLLVRLARFEGPGEYELIARSAFEWGFDKSYGPNWHGDEDIREGLIEAAKGANESAHGVLSSTFLKFVNPKVLAELPGWYSHDLRLLVMNLLANTNCDAAADNLATAYDRINEASH
jgi:serine/threonine protein kinase